MTIDAEHCPKGHTKDLTYRRDGIMRSIEIWYCPTCDAEFVHNVSKDDK